jgi:cobalamin synthase
MIGRLKIRGVVIALLVLAALALATGANWTDGWLDFGF